MTPETLKECELALRQWIRECRHTLDRTSHPLGADSATLWSGWLRDAEVALAEVRKELKR